MVEEVRPDSVDGPGEVASDGRQGLTLGTTAAWLSPGVPKPVAPRGIVEPTTDPGDPETAPPAPDVEPDALAFDEPDPQLFDSDDPPPSNAALELALGHGMISGLTPGVLISVEPSGMPPRPDELELSGELAVDGAPNGEVGPMLGVGLVCACAATIPIQTIAAMKEGYRIELPQFVVGLSPLVAARQMAKGQHLRESSSAAFRCRTR